MKDHKTDKLFKKKLEAFQKTPSPAAWNQLEKQLESKKEKGLWFYLRIAAMLFLIIGAGFLVSQIGDGIEQTGNQVAEEKTNTTKEVELKEVNDDKSNTEKVDTTAKGPKTKQVKDKKNSRSIDLQNMPQILASKTEENDKKVEPEQNTTTAIDQASTVAIANHDTKKDSSEILEEVILDDSALEETIAMNSTDAIEESKVEEAKLPTIKITYKKSQPALPRVDVVTLAINETTKSSEDEVSNDSRFKKMWNKAKDLKNNGISMADIRGAKDDLLAKPFNKNRSTN